MTRIAVLGSLMQDLVVRAPRLPAPGETIFGHEFGMFVGGKGGNQAIAAARLGAGHVAMIGRVGDDPFAAGILATLEAAGIEATHVTRDPHSGTGVALPIVLDDGSNSIISVPRANLAMTPADVERTRREIEAADILLLQFEVAMEATVAAATMAQRAGVPVLLNAAPVAAAPAGLIEAAGVIVVNEVEAHALAAFDGDRVAQARDIRSLGASTVVITLGPEGAVVCSDAYDGPVGAFAVRAVDSVGAGDAFCGALAVGMARGDELVSALRFASAAGAIAVTRPGAASSLPDRTEVEDLLRFGTFSRP